MPLDISGLKPVSLTKNATELPRNIRFNMVVLVNNLGVVGTPEINGQLSQFRPKEGTFHL